MSEKERLIDAYGAENVREVKGRLQVREQHSRPNGGMVWEWVESDKALPPVEPVQVELPEVPAEEVVTEAELEEIAEEALEETLAELEEDADEE